MSELSRALAREWPKAQWASRDGTYAGLIWEDAAVPKPSAAEVAAAIARNAAVEAAIEVPFFYLKLELKARPVGDSNLFHVIDTFVRELGGDALFKWENAPNVDSANELLLAVARQFGIQADVPAIFRAAQARIGNT